MLYLLLALLTKDYYYGSSGYWGRLCIASDTAGRGDICLHLLLSTTDAEAHQPAPTPAPLHHWRWSICSRPQQSTSVSQLSAPSSLAPRDTCPRLLQQYHCSITPSALILSSAAL
jgi:hypothetical protein